MEFGSNISMSEVSKLFDSSNPMDLVKAARKSTEFGALFADRLTQLLNHEFYETRSYSSKALGKINYDDAIPLILPLLKDKVEDVRFSSAEALGNFQDKRVIDALLSCFSDYSRETKRLATIGLSKQNSNQLYNAIMTRINQIKVEDYEMKSEESIEKIDIIRGTIEAMSEFEFDWVPEVLRFGIENKDLEIVRLSSITIGRLRLDEFANDLLKIKNHEDDDVRLAVVYALSRIEFDGKFEILISYKSDKYEFIRQILATYLPKNYGKNEIDPIIKEFATHEVDLVRSSFASSLLHEEYLPILEILICDRNPIVRREAIMSIGNIKISKSTEILEGLDETDELVKIAIENAKLSLQKSKIE